ncbi:MAG: linoleoyl-CoA desaturase [Lentimonas sp.]|jgi:linoleoyl-CoA desaturase
MDTQLNMSQVKFSKTTNEEFYKELRKKVVDYFKTTGKSRYSNWNMIAKTIFMCALYLTPLTLLLTVVESTGIAILMWSIMGFGMAGIGLSIMHDANHGAYSKNARVNKYLGYLIYLVGGHDVNWRIQHNVLHHTYTNISGLDEDINPGVVMRFNPHEPRLKGHKAQHIYAWALYGLMTLSWFLKKDIDQLISYNKRDLLSTQNVSFRRAMWSIVLTKLIYAVLILALPLIYSSPVWYVTILGFLLMHFIAGVMLGIIFQPAHCVPSSNYPVPDESGNIDADWAVNQLYNTANFAPGARLFSWYVGGLNYQVEHHLFPNICHVHYRNLSAIVKETASAYNLPYNSFKTFGNALKAHGKMLYDLGHYDEAPGLHH